MNEVASYLPIVALFALSTVFAAGSFMASRLLAPSKVTAAKTAPYECGIVPTREPADRFPVRFYLVAMIFIIFDIEIIFLYPWAVVFDELLLFGLIEMAVFALAVFVSFVYLISNGALDWGPPRQLRPAIIDPARTTETTVRRVGRDDETEAVPVAAASTSA